MTTQEQLFWRRSKVLELLAQGFNQSQVAEYLKLPKQTISDDVKALREESKERIKTHLEERLPLAYETCLQTLMDTRRRAYDIVNKPKEQIDDKTRLQAIQIINDSTMKYIDVMTHNETIKTVMSWNNKVNKQLEQQSTKDKAQSEQTNNEVDTNSNDTSGISEDSTTDTGTTDNTDSATTDDDTAGQDSTVF